MGFSLPIPKTRKAIFLDQMVINRQFRIVKVSYKGLAKNVAQFATLFALSMHHGDSESKYNMHLPTAQ